MPLSKQHHDYTELLRVRLELLRRRLIRLCSSLNLSVLTCDALLSVGLARECACKD